MSESKEILDLHNTIISIITSIFNNIHANVLLTKNFLDCKDIQHKTDCMRQVLENVTTDQNQFYARVVAIIKLHSKSMDENPKILNDLNKQLGSIGFEYDSSKHELTRKEYLAPFIVKFVDLKGNIIPNSFYEQLISEINQCYTVKAYNATSVMIRKLFENLILDLLRKRFSNDSSKKELFWKNNRIPRFVDLIKNFKAHLSEYTPFIKINDKDLFKFLNDIKYEGNESAHTIEEIQNKLKLDDKKDELKHIMELLFTLYDKIK